MQAFLKDNELIINSQILDNEKEALVNFANLAEEKGAEAIKLYDTNGDVAGVKFRVNS